MTIITLGPEGTYSHQAAKKYAPNATIVFAASIDHAVAAFIDQQAETMILPIENMIRGTVNETIDALIQHELTIVDEVILPIHHALMAQQATFKKIASHPQALYQCKAYLKKKYPDAKWEITNSTADGCKKASKNKTYATIGHPNNAEKYDLKTIDTCIEDFKHNKTRFWVITRELDKRGENTAMVIWPKKNIPGILYELLGYFKRGGIDLTKIESKPSKKKLGEYFFHIEVIGDHREKPLKNVLERIKNAELTEDIKILGTYS